MDNITHFSINNSSKNEKILLGVMPFWAPLIPPLGISCIKSFLKQNGYNVKIFDANIELGLWAIQHKYLANLKKIIPEDKMGNFYMIGYDVFMNHLMAYINKSSIGEYIEIVIKIISKNFFINITTEQCIELNNIINTFYSRLEKYILEIFEREKPTVFGLSVYSVSLAPSLFVFKLIKERFPNTRTVMGGGIFADQLSINSPDLEFFVEKTSYYIDNFIIGEGEILFLKLLQAELPENKKVYSIQDIESETYDISKAVLPDFSDLNVKRYTQMASYASRSCPYQCSFCSETVQWGSYRKKNANQVVDELIELNNLYGRKLFLLGDSLINPLVTELSQEFINRKVQIYWDAYLRADKPVCDIKNTMLWRQGGFYRARLGIESGSQHVLDLMNKKTTVFQIKEALKCLAQAGIKTTTYWVIGHPGETEEDFLETLDLLEEIKDFIYEADWHPFYYFPSGQVNSEKWRKEYDIFSLYSEDSKDMLITQTWVLNSNPSRDETYNRLCRFEKQCKLLGIPNPYTYKDIYIADERWASLHQNAVPKLIDIGQ